MRISELLEQEGQQREVYASSRWNKDWETAVQTPDFEKNFDEWLAHWKKGSLSHIPYDAKDAVLAGESKIGSLPVDPETKQKPPKVRRWHAISGKIIVLYQLYPDAIMLIAAGPHDIEEKKNLDIIAKWLKDYKRSNWKTWTKPAPAETSAATDKPKVKAKPLTPQERETINQMFPLLADDKEGKSVLLQLSKTDALPWLMWARAAIGLDPDNSSRDGFILGAFGGRKELAQLAASYITGDS